MGDYTTDETGYASTGKLKPGSYTVLELSNGDDYWNCELGYHSVTIIAGKATEDAWHNREQGLGWFHKSTNTGESLEGWEITIYSDKECTQKVTTVTTNADGKVGIYLDPGIYYARETGDTEGRFENEYWLADESIGCPLFIPTPVMRKKAPAPVRASQMAASSRIKPGW